MKEPRVGQEIYFQTNFNYMKNEEIEKIVVDLHEKMGIKQVPVPIEQIVESLGIKIKRAPSEDFSGLLLRKDGKALMGINDSEPHVRQRFTIAHELGHFYLHPAKDAFVDYRHTQGGGVRSSKERQANIFAAAFLIPRITLIAEVNKRVSAGIFDAEIEELAKKYDVSKESMNYRLLNLGLTK